MLKKISRGMAAAAVASMAVAAPLMVAPTTISTVASAEYTDMQPEGYGPTKPFRQVIYNNDVYPLMDEALISRIEHGYRYISGNHKNTLTVTKVAAGIKYRDTTTQRWDSLPPACTAQRVSVGISAICVEPPDTSVKNPLILEIWPRLANDFIDGRTMPARFQMAVLADAGFDTVYTGYGRDFVNGAQDPDRVYMGAGADWVRTGTGNDQVWGEAGADYMVGAENNDTVWGGAGNDQVRGGPNDDTLYGGEGTDLAAGDDGYDTAYIDQYDRTVNVERVYSE